MLGSAFPPKQLALSWLEHAFQNFATLCRSRISHAHAWHLEQLFGIPLRVFVSNAQRRLRYEPEPPPFEIRSQLKYFCHGSQCSTIPFPRHNPFVLILNLRLPIS